MPGESELERLIRSFRNDVLKRERNASSELVRVYGEIWNVINRRLQQLELEKQEALAHGEEIGPHWLYQRQRLKSLQMQVEAELREFARLADETIRRQQEDAIRAAQDHARQLVLIQLPERAGTLIQFDLLPQDAIYASVGSLQDGSPLRDILDELGREVSRGVGNALVTSLATGMNPRQTARMVRRQFGIGLARALRITRTETLRAYRWATRESYRRSEVVKGWIWHAALDDRTCVSCIAMHGTMHSLNESLDDHPNGRCAMVPVTVPWRELGLDEKIPETRIQIQKGEEWFDTLSPDKQQQILGKQAFDAYSNLKVDLRDFVGQKRDARWGTMRYRLSLRRALNHSGMPQVQWGDPQAQRALDVRQAIRIIRDAGANVRGLRIILRGPQQEWFGLTHLSERADEIFIEMANNIHDWEQDREYWQRVHEEIRVPVRLPNSASERLAETLAHEFGHVLTIQREGIYPSRGMPGLPRHLYEWIVRDLTRAGLNHTWYNIGEVIADDVRRVLLGRETRLNYYTYPADRDDIEQSWQRAREIFRWLTEE
jgi:SPP1 gp7 family putative phage head morphogenesis protein